MTGSVQIEDFSVFTRYAATSRGVAHLLLKAGTVTRSPVDPGPDGVFATVVAAVDRAHDRLAVLLTDVYNGIGGLAYAADYIGVKFPSVDLTSSLALHRLAYRAEDAAPEPTGPRPDPRFVTAETPR